MSNVKRIRANRHFDQLRAGDELNVDVSDGYWANQILAGNIEVLEESPAEESADDVALKILLGEDFIPVDGTEFGLEDEAEFPEGDPED